MKYINIANEIVKQIEDGTLKSGQKLPSVRDGAELFECNKNTIIKAYEHLENSKHIYALERSGYYVLGQKNQIDQSDILYDFASANPTSEVIPYQYFKSCLEIAIDKYKENLFQYVSPRGLESLSSALLKQLMENQVYTTKEQLFITSGTQQSIDILSRLKFPGGRDKILVEQPVYSGAIKAAN